ncbi:hypothetical protein I552_2323 [Mycobacterium xenopi 3993]|nr:hypothetical protein I552_2323 [Mycobacterium xenopi 3993]
MTAGGMWLWDDSSPHPPDAPFYEYFAHLKLPTQYEPACLAFPTGMRIEVHEPLMAYGIAYDDRSRISAQLQFEALEPRCPCPPANRRTRMRSTSTKPVMSPGRSHSTGN